MAGVRGERLNHGARDTLEELGGAEFTQVNGRGTDATRLLLPRARASY